jgi:hypothetical protein
MEQNSDPFLKVPADPEKTFSLAGDSGPARPRYVPGIRFDFAPQPSPARDQKTGAARSQNPEEPSVPP